MFVNLIMGWWSMYPPFFVTGKNPVPEKRVFDKYSLRRLAQLCREGAGNVIGFHPEGTRNKNSDPYTYLRPQPGHWQTHQGSKSAGRAGFHRRFG